MRWNTWVCRSMARAVSVSRSSNISSTICVGVLRVGWDVRARAHDGVCVRTRRLRLHMRACHVRACRACMRACMRGGICNPAHTCTASSRVWPIPTASTASAFAQEDTRHRQQEQASGGCPAGHACMGMHAWHRTKCAKAQIACRLHGRRLTCSYKSSSFARGSLSCATCGRTTSHRPLLMSLTKFSALSTVLRDTWHSFCTRARAMMPWQCQDTRAAPSLLLHIHRAEYHMLYWCAPGWR